MWELLTLKGEKLQVSAREFLMVGFLNSGQPMSLFLAKAIIAAITGGAGCNAGIGFAGLIMAGIVARKFFRRKR